MNIKDQNHNDNSLFSICPYSVNNRTLMPMPSHYIFAFTHIYTAKVLWKRTESVSGKHSE